jgi:hypothetical protein
MAEGASTNTTRKIATLRRWSENPCLIDAKYLSEIADEMERVYNIMIERAETIDHLGEQLDVLARGDER